MHAGASLRLSGASSTGLPSSCLAGGHQGGRTFRTVSGVLSAWKGCYRGSGVRAGGALGGRFQTQLQRPPSPALHSQPTLSCPPERPELPSIPGLAE